jgi:5-methylcytosine-specific restriction protein A
MPDRSRIDAELSAQMQPARVQKRPHVELNAGELHRIVGGYPSPDHKIPLCSADMRRL